MSLLNILGALGGGIEGGYSVIEARRKRDQMEADREEAKAERERIKAERIATRQAQHGFFDRNRSSSAKDNGADLAGAGDAMSGAPGIDLGALPFAMKVAGQSVERAGKQPTEFDPNVDYGGMIDIQDKEQGMADRRRNTASTLSANKAYRQAIDEDRDSRNADLARQNDIRIRGEEETRTRGANARKILGPQAEGLTDAAAIELLANKMEGRASRTTGGGGGAVGGGLEKLIGNLEQRATSAEKRVPKGNWRALDADPANEAFGITVDPKKVAAATADSTALARTAEGARSDVDRALRMQSQQIAPGFPFSGEEPEPQGSQMGPGGVLAGQGMEHELSQVDFALKNGPGTPERIARAEQMKAQIRMKYGQPSVPSAQGVLDQAMSQRNGTYVTAKPQRPTLNSFSRLMGDS